jgi:serine/threonine protein phosphatase PrpC
MSALVQVEFGAHSQTGAARVANTDHYLVLRLGRHQEAIATSLTAADLPPRFDEYGYAMVIADGGGVEASGSGALASRTAISALAHLAIHYGQWTLRVDPGTAESVIDRAEWFYQHAGRAVHRARLSDPSRAEMCTTLTSTFSAGDEMFYAHVGNSRAYLFRDGELTQLTRDHTLEQRLTDWGGPVGVPPGTHDLRHVLTDAIGAGGDAPQVDVERLRLCDNDTILLCSDGLCAAVDDELIAEVLANPRRPNDQCAWLVGLAARRGADDDATALLAHYRIPRSPAIGEDR